jgi:CheY-like chemotaxis protein
VLSASQGLDAVAIAISMVTDVVRLDVTMPGLDGYEVYSLLETERLTCDIPLFFLTGLGMWLMRARRWRWARSTM